MGSCRANEWVRAYTSDPARRSADDDVLLTLAPRPTRGQAHASPDARVAEFVQIMSHLFLLSLMYFLQIDGLMTNLILAVVVALSH
jgi:hypothetical protein